MEFIERRERYSKDRGDLTNLQVAERGALVSDRGCIIDVITGLRRYRRLVSDIEHALRTVVRRREDIEQINGDANAP